MTRHRVAKIAAAVAFAAVLGAGVWAMVVGFAPLDDAAPEPGDPRLPAIVAGLPPVSSAELLPGWLAIPDVRIKAATTPVTLRDKTLPVPSDERLVGVTSTAAPLCSEEGTTLMAGHVSSYGHRGALYSLAAVQPGMELTVACSDGRRLTYVAHSAPEIVRKLTVDPSLNTPTGPARVVLITCGGPVMPDGHYRDNVIVVFDRRL